MTLYMLDKSGQVVPTDDVLEWANWFEKADRVAARTVVGPLTVSTVFLGVKTCGAAPTDLCMDYLWETMVSGSRPDLDHLSTLDNEDRRSIFAKVFGGKDYQRRYKSLQEALDGHKEVVKLCQRAVAAYN